MAARAMLKLELAWLMASTWMLFLLNSSLQHAPQLGGFNLGMACAPLINENVEISPSFFQGVRLRRPFGPSEQETLLSERLRLLYSGSNETGTNKR